MVVQGQKMKAEIIWACVNTITIKKKPYWSIIA